ncbi:hypothetical protein [Streptomyces sp. NPDC057636]
MPCRRFRVARRRSCPWPVGARLADAMSTRWTALEDEGLAQVLHLADT